MRHYTSPRSGFALVDTLIALVVFVLTLNAIMQVEALLKKNLTSQSRAIYDAIEMSNNYIETRKYEF